MNRSSLRSSPPAVTDQIAARWAPTIIVLALIVIVVSTLYPFKFVFTNVFPLKEIFYNFRSPTTRLDILANVILFAPLGFGLASLIAKRPYSLITKLLAIVIVCGGFSLAIEIAQVFLPGRKATPMDVVSNALGGGVGYVGFVIGKVPLYVGLTIATEAIQRFFKRFSVKQLTSGLVVYIGLAMMLVVVWKGTGLSGWDSSASLILGNNSSLDNPFQGMMQSLPWEGTMSNLVIRDRVLSKSEVENFFASSPISLQNDSSVLANYTPDAQGIADQRQQAPRLDWQGKRPAPDSASSATTVKLTGDRWLASAIPIETVNQRIQQSAQFTLSAVVAANNPDVAPRHFRRIISLSSPANIDNLVLVQTKKDLGVWLRTTKSQGDRYPYSFIVPQVFADAQPHRILVTYGGFVLRVYVDNSDRFYIADLTPNRYQIILYGLILIPFAFLTGLIANRLRDRLLFYILLLAGGTLLPALLLEVFLASEGERSIRVANLLLSMVIVGGTLIASRGNSLRRAI